MRFNSVSGLHKHQRAVHGLVGPKFLVSAYTSARALSGAVTCCVRDLEERVVSLVSFAG